MIHWFNKAWACVRDHEQNVFLNLEGTLPTRNKIDMMLVILISSGWEYCEVSYDKYIANYHTCARHFD